MEEQVFELVGTEIFDSVEDAIAILWWILHVTGGKIAFPTEEEFWLTNYPQGARLVLRKEDGKLVLEAQHPSWTADPPGSFD